MTTNEMTVGVFSTKRWVKEMFTEKNAAYGFKLQFLEARLTDETVSLAAGFDAVCVFVNDVVDANVLRQLHAGGTRLIALRCAGFNNVDIREAHKLGICVTRVPAYSPYAVAEHALALILALNRKIYRAAMRVRDGNFALDGLLGFDMRGKTVGVVGTGKIGKVVVDILNGFGCRILASDKFPDPKLVAKGVTYVPLDELYAQSDIVTLHCPLTHESHHMINAETVAKMKTGVMIINTSRGPLIDTAAVIEGLKSGKIGYLGLDVYEEESDLFFEDLSGQVIQDDIFSRLQTFPNVLVTGHQAFFTREAIENIVDTTLSNVAAFAENRACQNAVLPDQVIVPAKK